MNWKKCILIIVVISTLAYLVFLAFYSFSLDNERKTFCETSNFFETQSQYVNGICYKVIEYEDRNILVENNFIFGGDLNA